MANDTLSNALNIIKTHEVAGKRDCEIQPTSRLIREVLGIFQKHGYIGDFEYIDDGTSGSFKVKLLGKVNKCSIIKPRFSVKATEWNKWEQRYIPSKDFGFIIVSTPVGLMTNREAREKNIGGRLIAFIY